MPAKLSFDRKGVGYHVVQFNGEGTLETLKDFGADETIHYAINQGANIIAAISSGNKANALKKAAFRHNTCSPLEEMVRVVHIIGPGDKYMETGLRDSDAGFVYSIPYVFGEMQRKWLTPEDRISIAATASEQYSHDSFKAKGIVDVTHFIPNEYVKKAEEILLRKYNGRHLDYLGIPVGTGSAYLAFRTALKNLQSRGIDITAKLVGIVPKGEHPIYHKFVFTHDTENGIEHIIEKFDPVSTANKLSCPWTDLLPELIEAKREGHIFIEVDKKSVVKANIRAVKVGKKHGQRLTLEDSGSVAFSLLDPTYAKQAGINAGDNVGIFITGRGLYATPSWEQKRIEGERRLQFIKEVIAVSSLIGGLISAPIVLPYLAGKAGLINYDSHMRQVSIRQQKTEMIRNILHYDNTMFEALSEIDKKYERILPYDYSSYPDPIVDEIILRYLKINEEKILKARDPRDVTVFEQLRFLVMMGEELKKK
ncbi:hypothetical protein HYS31_07070 [Candidatus Woesearchaeota archaeon]|nr:hypothetical protein [Candidatus Woesearchaeota archaeon]